MKLYITVWSVWLGGGGGVLLAEQCPYIAVVLMKAEHTDQESGPGKANQTSVFDRFDMSILKSLRGMWLKLYS